MISGVREERTKTTGRLSAVGFAGVERAVNLLCTLNLYAAQALCFALMSFITYDVVARYVFNMPTAWSNEVSTMMFVAIVYLGLGYAAIEDRHVRLDILVSRMSPIWQKRWMSLMDAIGLVVAVFITWRAYALVLEAYRIDERIEASILRFPMWIPETAIVVGLTIFCLRLAVQVYRQLKEMP